MALVRCTGARRDAGEGRWARFMACGVLVLDAIGGEGPGEARRLDVRRMAPPHAGGGVRAYRDADIPLCSAAHPAGVLARQSQDRQSQLLKPD